MKYACPLYPEDDDLICMHCAWTDSTEFDNENDVCPHDEKIDKKENACSKFSCNEQCRLCPRECPCLSPNNDENSPFR